MGRGVPFVVVGQQFVDVVDHRGELVTKAGAFVATLALGHLLVQLDSVGLEDLHQV